MDYVMGDGAGNVFLLNGNLVAAPVAEISTNFDGSLLSIVGEEANYTGDVTTDSWVNTKPSGTVDGVFCGASAYLGNDVLIAGLRDYNNHEVLHTPYISRDAGVTWQELPAGLGYVSSLTTAIGPGKAVSTNLYDGAISYTEDYGETWVTKCTTKPGGQSVLYIGYAGKNGANQDVLVAGTYPNGKIFYSTDNAATWTESTYVSYTTKISSPVGFGNGVVCMLQDNGKIIRSEDFGQTWTQTYDISSSGSSHGYISKLNNGRLMVNDWTWSSAMTGARYYSDDSGLTWTSINDTHSALYTALGNDQVLALKTIYTYGGGAYGKGLVYAYSNDNGLTFGNYTSIGYTAEAKVLSAHYVGNGRTVIATTMSIPTNSSDYMHEFFNPFTLGTF